MPDPLNAVRLLNKASSTVFERLLESYSRDEGRNGEIVSDIANCIVAVELHHASYDETRARYGHASEPGRDPCRVQRAL